jgi:hypothetical protein
MSSAAAVPAFASHPPQLFSLLAAMLIVGVCLAGAFIVLSLFVRELSCARILCDRQSPDVDFSAPRKPAVREISPYTRGQFQGRRKASL